MPGLGIKRETGNGSEENALALKRGDHVLESVRSGTANDPEGIFGKNS